MSQHTLPPRTTGKRPAPAARRKRRKSIVDQRRTPWGLIAIVAGVAVLAAAMLAVALTTSGSSGTKSAGNGSPDSAEVLPAPVTGTTTQEIAPRTATDTSGIPGVLAWNTQGWPGDGSSVPGALQHDHVDGPVRYTETPPVGGPHSGVWLNAGIYDQPVPSERAVHNLEHGAVWITYDPNLPAAQVATLRAFVLGQTTLPEQSQAGHASSRYIVMSPWSTSSLPAPIVISSWGHQLRVSAPDDPRLQQFVDMFRSSKTYTPEAGEAVDGVPVSVGGQPLAN